MSEKNKVMAHLGHSEKSGKKDERKIHTHKLTVERADHGGHHLTHHMRDDEGNDAGTQTSIAPDNEAMGQQVQNAMGDQPPAGEGAPPQTTPAVADPTGGMGQ